MRGKTIHNVITDNLIAEPPFTANDIAIALIEQGSMGWRTPGNLRPYFNHLANHGGSRSLTEFTTDVI
jgi:hypothetical protein